LTIHLTCHSAYSLQEGLATPAELVQVAAEYGISALGLIDHNPLKGRLASGEIFIGGNVNQTTR
jgi:DNA polymerase III alpha subunit